MKKAERKLFCGMYSESQSCKAIVEEQELCQPVDYLAVAEKNGIDAAKANVFVVRWQELKLLSDQPPVTLRTVGVECGGNMFWFTKPGEEKARQLLEEQYNPNYYAIIERWAKGHKPTAFVLFLVGPLGLFAFFAFICGVFKSCSSN